MLENTPANAGDMGSIPRSGRSPGGGSGNPSPYSCLGNLMNRGAWQTPVRSCKESDRTKHKHTEEGYTLPQTLF